MLCCISLNSTWSFSSQSPARSLSPASSSSDFETSPLSPVSAVYSRIWYDSNDVAQTFSFSSRRRQRKLRNKALHAITYGSSSDLTADTPISTYVRRKTPGTSPTSPTFAPDSGYESSSSPTAMPFSIPSLPDLLANSSSSEIVPSLPSSDSEFEDHVKTFRSRVKRISKSNNKNCRIVRRSTGVRISVPPYPINLRERFMDLWSIQFYTQCFVGLFCLQPFLVVLSNPFLSPQISVQQYATQNPSQYIKVVWLHSCQGSCIYTQQKLAIW